MRVLKLIAVSVLTVILVEQQPLEGALFLKNYMMLHNVKGFDHKQLDRKCQFCQCCAVPFTLPSLTVSVHFFIFALFYQCCKLFP